MKSRPYVLWLILAGIALAVWLAWPSGKELPGSRVVLAPATPTPSTASAPASVSGDHPMAPLPSVAVAPSNVAQPSGTALAAGSPAAGQPNGASTAVLNSGVPGATNQAAQTDAVRVRHMISDYHTLMGENPVGTNAEIMKQMTGGNARQATLGPPDGISLNAQGELVDQWGTPYFFHQLSRDKMEIRSAGPDKVMWTADDVIAR